MISSADSGPGIYVFTYKGLLLGQKLHPSLGGRLYVAASLQPEGDTPLNFVFFKRLSALMQHTFSRHKWHLFISACGIAVRAVAPLLRGKMHDPGVLAMDQDGRFVISILSGHLGGANAMAKRVASLVDACPVITTATDCEGLPAIDILAAKAGLAFANAGAIKTISAALLAGKPVGLYDPLNFLGIADSGHAPLFPPFKKWAKAPLEQGACVVVSESVAPFGKAPGHSCLLLHPPVLFAGIGCKRGVNAARIINALARVFSQQQLALPSLVCLASLVEKADEQGLIEAAAALHLPLRLFRRKTLASLPVSALSPKALEIFGLPGVCEPAALAAARGITPEAVLLPPAKNHENIPSQNAQQSVAMHCMPQTTLARPLQNSQKTHAFSCAPVAASGILLAKGVRLLVKKTVAPSVTVAVACLTP